MAFSSHRKGLPPRTNGSKGSSESMSPVSTGFSPYLPQYSHHHASPRTTKYALAMKKVVTTANASASSPSSPRRPMSASRVQPTVASISNSIAGGTYNFHSSPYSSRTRPASASRARVSTRHHQHVQQHPLVAVETIAFPSKRLDLVSLRDGDFEPKATDYASPKSQRPTSARSVASICNSIRMEEQRAPVPMDATEKAKLRSFLESWQDEELSFRSSILFSETTFAQAKGTSPGIYKTSCLKG